jgi:hypothetical protein
MTENYKGTVDLLGYCLGNTPGTGGAGDVCLSANNSIACHNKQCYVAVFISALKYDKMSVEREIKKRHRSRNITPFRVLSAQ